MLVTSIFSFSHNVFKRPLSQGREKSELCGKELTLLHTIPTFNDPKEEGLDNIVGKRENADNHHFVLFLVFSTQLKRKIVIVSTLNLSSANAFSLVTSKMLPFGRALNHIDFLELIELEDDNFDVSQVNECVFG